MNSSFSFQVSIGCRPVSGQVFGAVRSVAFACEGLRTRSVAPAGQRRGGGGAGRWPPQELRAPAPRPAARLSSVPSELRNCSAAPPGTAQAALPLPPTRRSVRRLSPHFRGAALAGLSPVALHVVSAFSATHTWETPDPEFKA